MVAPFAYVGGVWPGGMGRIVGKLNELWALVGAVNAMRGANSKGSTDGVEWAVVDEEGLNQIVQVWPSAAPAPCYRPGPIGITVLTNCCLGRFWWMNRLG